MKIVNHKLVAEAGDAPIPFVATSNQGNVIVPRYLIIHYTAGSSAASSINWFTNPAASASAHLVIAMDGSITQMVSFNRKAWHAGVSRWNTETGLNNLSIGIELDNPGKLIKVGDKWRSWFGGEYPEDVVLQARHKHQDMVSGWHIFTQAQLDACIRVSSLLVIKYGLLDILGHDDVAPFRKEDPGPAFPMESFKSYVLGRNDDVAEIFEVTTDGTNFRPEPGLSNTPMGQLNQGMRVEFIKSQNSWYYVFVVSATSSLKEREGWVHSSLLMKV